MQAGSGAGHDALVLERLDLRGREADLAAAPHRCPARVAGALRRWPPGVRESLGVMPGTASSRCRPSMCTVFDHAARLVMRVGLAISATV
jgi:hypothetical protein